MTFDSDKVGEPPAVFPPSTTTGSPANTTTTDAGPRDIAADVHELLIAASAPLSVEEIQRELGEPHVPEGQIVKALVHMGARMTQVDGVDVWSCLAVKDAETLAQRRADVLQAMIRDPIGGWDVESIARYLTTQHPLQGISDDLDALLESGALVATNDEDLPYALTYETRSSIIRRGAEAVARSTIPELTRPIENRTAFELAATERFEAEKKAKHVAIGERDRLATFLRENGQDVAAILSPPAPVTPGPKRDEFMSEKKVEWTEMVELELRRKDAALRGKLQLSEAALDAEKARHRAVRDGIEEELREIRLAIDEKVYIQREQAYREPRWSESVTLVVRMSDGAILERLPIAKGLQRTIPGTEKAPVHSAAPSTDAATVAAREAGQVQVAKAEAVEPTFKGKLNVEAFIEPARAVLAIVGAEGITEDDARDAVATRVGLDAPTAGQRTLIGKAFQKLVNNGDARLDEGCYFASHAVRKIPGEDEPEGEEAADDAPESEEPKTVAPPKRGRGRPKGSMNKTKAGK
jgi:hypothetical protein